MALAPKVSDKRLRRVTAVKIQQIFQISFCEMLKGKLYQVKVPVRRFHMNGNIIGLSPDLTVRTTLNSGIHAGYQRVNSAKSSIEGYCHKAVLLLAAVYVSLD